MILFVFDRVQNIVGKGENAGLQHFLLFPQCFEKASFQEKGVIVWEWVNTLGLFFVAFVEDFVLRTKFVTKNEMNKCMAEI